MKPRLSTQREAGLTLFEVCVVVAIVIILLALLLPPVSRANRKPSLVSCSNNLKQIEIAYRIWEGDNNDLYPTFISITNGGSMELSQTGNVARTFQVMSNELGTPKILICPGDVDGPGDTNRTFAINFSSLANSNISYFVGVDVTTDVDPRGIFSGDSNFEIGGRAVGSGLMSYSTNNPVAWTASRHSHSGNLGFADGSVQSTTSPQLQGYFIEADVATNRLAIP